MPLKKKAESPRIRFFATPADFRKWLEAHHKNSAELWVGFYKKGSGKASITWPESVDEALCVGWIDGVRRSLDAERYTIRFSPRPRAPRPEALRPLLVRTDLAHATDGTRRCDFPRRRTRFAGASSLVAQCSRWSGFRLRAARYGGPASRTLPIHSK